MERFVIIVNGWKPLTIITKRSILDVAAVLQYLTYIIETKSIPGQIYENSGMAHFAEINQAPSAYSMLQH